jgi:hypothetical protein
MQRTARQNTIELLYREPEKNKWRPRDPRVVARPAAPSGPTWRPRNVNIQQQRASRRCLASFRLARPQLAASTTTTKQTFALSANHHPPPSPSGILPRINQVTQHSHFHRSLTHPASPRLLRYSPSTALTTFDLILTSHHVSSSSSLSTDQREAKKVTRLSELPSTTYLLL